MIFFSRISRGRGECHPGVAPSEGGGTTRLLGEARHMVLMVDKQFLSLVRVRLTGPERTSSMLGC